MIRQFNLILLTLCIFSLTGCLKEELPIEPHQQGEVLTNQVDMGSDYGSQIYFNLNDNSVVGQNLRTDWDIAFEARTSGWHVLLNSSLGGKAANTGETDFNLVVGLTGNENWNVDNPTGNLDSTAVGDYLSTGEVFIIDRGYDISGNPLGYKKVQIDYSSISDSYQFRCSSFDGSSDTNLSISKDTNYNFIAFSFNSNSLIDIEPVKTSWDLLFTKYLEIFPGFGPYGVTGVLTNNFQTTQVAIDTVNDFESISYDLIQQYEFSLDMNAIGWDWKQYDMSSGTYTVDVTKNYIVKNQNGLYFKLRFIDFYDDIGEKGAPKFELQKL